MTYTRPDRKEIYERYCSSLLAICFRYMGRRDEAEDALHDIFIKVFGKLDHFSYRSEVQLSAWLKRTAVNHCIDRLRRRNLFISPLSEDFDIAGEGQADSEDVQKIPPDLLLKFISELPEGYRTVFNLYCIEGMSHKEIAAALGIAEKSSSSQYARARALLAQKIKRYWNDTQQ